MSVLCPSASRFRGRATNAEGYEFLYKMETAGRWAYGWKERPGAVQYQI